MPYAYQTFSKPKSPIDVLTEEYIDKLQNDLYSTKHQSDHSETVTETAPQDDGGANTRSSRKWHPRTHKRHSVDTTVLHLEWHNFGFKPGAFNLELWWYKSRLGSRLNALIVLILLVFALIHGIGGMYFIISHIFYSPSSNPYVCTTPECEKAATWMLQTMDQGVEPCENFYEFVCGNKIDLGEEINIITGIINEPGYKVEFGENSILSKILKSFNENEEVKNEPIKYYQTCLNERARKQFGLNALVDTIQHVFDTTDLTIFEASSLQLETVGERMFRVMGHAVYLNMAFQSYPYIQRWLPLQWLRRLSPTSFDDQTIRVVLRNLMPLLGMSGNSAKIIVNEIVNGMLVIVNVLHKISVVYKLVPPLDFTKSIEIQLKGLCPPMGIKMNTKKIFESFIGEKYRMDYVNPETEAYSRTIEYCFNEDPSKFTIGTFTFPKTAVAGIWIFGLIHDFFPEIDQSLVKSFGLNESLPLGSSLFRDSNFQQEYKCLKAMWTNLGYLPTIRYLQATVKDPVELSSKIAQEIQILFKETGQNWQDIPKEQIWEPQRFLGKTILGRGLHSDVIMPGVDNHLWEADLDSLNLTNDHLRNSLLGVRFTVEMARQSWLGSTDPESHVKWWGDGFNGVSIRNLLFSLQQSCVVSPRFLEQAEAARRGEWEKFLGRIPYNYILFSFSLINEPHTSENLWLENGGISFKIIRTFLALISDVFKLEKYSLTTWMNPFVIVGDYSNSTDNYNCFSFDNAPDQNMNGSFDYRLKETTMQWFSWQHEWDFLNTLAVKFTLKHFRKQRQALLELPFHWSLDNQTKNQRLHRFLPGELSKYTEDQLLFMAIVRQNCRGSWKKMQKNKNRVYVLETIILEMFMQSEEFSQAFKCKQNSFMNLGSRRCLQWIP